MVPDNGIKLRKDDYSRNGCIVVPRTKKGMNSLRINSFSVRGPDVFNSLLKDLRELESSMEVYKGKLNKFLELIPDIPRIGRGSHIESNNLDDCIKKWRWNIGHIM